MTIAKDEVYLALMDMRRAAQPRRGWTTLRLADAISQTDRRAFLGDVWCALKLLAARGIVELRDTGDGQAWFFLEEQSGNEKH